MAYSKVIRKRLRELVGIAYERELRLELEQLDGKFQLWHDGAIDSFELEHCIHRFHNGAARELYCRYTDVPPELVLPYALANHLIADEELPEEAFAEIKGRASLFAASVRE